MERDAFLARVAQARAQAWFPPTADPEPDPLVPELAPVDLADLFAERLEALSGSVHRAGDPVDIITRIARTQGADELIAWDPDELPVPGLLAALGDRGIDRVETEVPRDPAGRLTRQRSYMGVALGVTGAEAGFAETGSIVVRSGPGRPRMASLIPAVHVALLPAEKLYRSLAHWGASHAGTVADATNLVFITGPSRTGDIEMRLNLGVHGPGDIHVILL